MDESSHRGHALLYTLGNLLFGHFEADVPLARRVLKVLIFLAITALLSAWSPVWGLVYVLGLLTVGSVFHFIWCTRNGINPFTAEPRERYYRLRGWR